MVTRTLKFSTGAVKQLALGTTMQDYPTVQT